MNVSFGDLYGRATTNVTLSLKNVLTLAAKGLGYDPDHNGTIYRNTENGLLSVTVESDEEHYGKRAYAAGIMPYECEAYIERTQQNERLRALVEKLADDKDLSIWLTFEGLLQQVGIRSASKSAA